MEESNLVINYLVFYQVFSIALFKLYVRYSVFVS